MSAPIGNTCPDVNRAIKNVEDIRKNLSYVLKYDDSTTLAEFKGILEDVEYDLRQTTDSFEDLRKSNSTLREWGIEMEQEAETLKVQYDELQEKYDLMERRLLDEKDEFIN